MKYRVGIVVPVLNYFQGFADLVLSINTKYDYKIYMQPQWYRQVPLSKAWNNGAKQAFAEGCDFAIVCNDDILFAPECIDAMIDEYNRLKDDKVRMITPNNIYGELNSDKYAVLNYKLPEGHEVSIADHPNFSCFLISPDFFRDIGYFDENFDPAWYEDNDAHYRASLLGYRLICTTAAPMVHLGSITTSLMTNPSSQKSHEYYIRKWGSCNRDLNEVFKRPYNDDAMTARDWIQG